MLTKKQIDAERYSVTLPDGQPVIWREYSKKVKNEDGTTSTITYEKEIKQIKNTTVHPYGTDKTYLLVSIMIDGRRKSVQVGRLVYAYFKGDIPDNYDVDHIDNNPFNNHPSNLQIISRRENLAKRLLSPSEINYRYWSIKKSKEAN